MMWNQLSVAQRAILLEVYMHEYCLESEVYFCKNYGNYKTHEALLKHGLVRLQGQKLITTEKGRAIVPPECITFPIYKKS